MLTKCSVQGLELSRRIELRMTLDIASIFNMWEHTSSVLDSWIDSSTHDTTETPLANNTGKLPSCYQKRTSKYGLINATRDLAESNIA